MGIVNLLYLSPDGPYYGPLVSENPVRDGNDGLGDLRFAIVGMTGKLQ